MLRRLCLATTVALVSLSTAACSGGDDGDSQSTQPQVTSSNSGPLISVTDDTGDEPEVTQASLPIVTSATDRVGCKAKVSGEITAEFTGKDDLAAFSSDYYLGDDEIAQANQLFSDVGTDVASSFDSDFTAGEEPDFTLPPRPEGAAPVIAWFLLNCQGGDISISFYSNGNSTPDDVPFGPGVYTIAPGGILGASDDPKQFSALISFGTQVETIWVTDEGASITITDFDGKGAKGAFKVPMKEAAIGGPESDKRLVVEGTFDMTCKSGSKCESD